MVSVSVSIVVMCACTCVCVCLYMQILLAPAGGKEWDATDPYADYYGPDGGPIDFMTPVDVSMY